MTYSIGELCHVRSFYKDERYYDFSPYTLNLTVSIIKALCDVPDDELQF